MLIENEDGYNFTYDQMYLQGGNPLERSFIRDNPCEEIRIRARAAFVGLGREKNDFHVFYKTVLDFSMTSYYNSLMGCFLSIPNK